ncbi:hypothetical protein [Hyperthermus butylicus]|uniref:Pantoate kinase n=1 Tax=Hyperthermus butylicus (strain DSM 5456 / JCM 9403 / PLM1-5) TaxID=415426 RepID=A2BK86_HYPBU|nr:hypothetical protein [Hyperthermus butylicus]ABM80397.1 hypothetical protein Hbut_0537 [Hyperthermus butylicus DSM 5456]
MYEFPLALVFAGVPIPGRSNPYIVLVTPNTPIGVDVDVEESDKPLARVTGASLGWRFELAVKSFVDTVAARLEQPVSISLRVVLPSSLQYPPPASVYAAVTLAIVASVAEAGGYSMDPYEVLEAANSIDEEGGVGLDFIDAMRTAIVRGESIVYRRGEDSVPLSMGSRVELELVGEDDIGEDMSRQLDESVMAAVTRLGGMAVVAAVQKLRSSDFSHVFQLVSRVDNALFHLLYGVQTPEGPCKWTPSLQRVYGVCLEAGLGDKVEFTL